MAAKGTTPGKSWEGMLFTTAVQSSRIITPVGQAVASWKGWRSNSNAVAGGPEAGLALLLSIFWEESLFNNVLQTGAGTAVGFGQVEPAEFYKFDAATLQSKDASMREAARSAEVNGYLVYNLPRRVKNGKATTLAGKLSDFDAATVAAAALRHVYEVKGRNIQTALDAYAGIGFKGTVPDHLSTDGARRTIIDGWLACARDLYESGLVTERPDPDAVMNALNKSRPFANLRAAFRPVLFPGR